MFRCAVTKKVTEPGEPMTRVVVQTRAKQYINYKWDEETGEKVRIDSQGYETVKEICVSPEGMKILQEEADVKAAGEKILKQRRSLLERLS